MNFQYFTSALAIGGDDIALIWTDLVGVQGLFSKLMFFNVKSKPGAIYPVTEGKWLLDDGIACQLSLEA